MRLGRVSAACQVKPGQWHDGILGTTSRTQAMLKASFAGVLQPELCQSEAFAPVSPRMTQAKSNCISRV
jgi:hypothetical protein